MTTKSHVVVVTGGSGFVGQHVIKHLQLHAPFVTEIRVLDIAPYTQKLKGFTQKIPVHSHVSDINNAEKVAAVLKGVDSVLHLASVVDSRFHPNVDLMQKVNVEGTKIIIQACIEENIQRLVYCGSITPYQGWEDVKDGNENTLKHNENCIIRDYGNSKAAAEKMVLEANGRVLQNGKYTSMP
ncbi:hypothetical protein FSP39_022470 [Pinctada imbricata]|uniref:3-beta hydroxysteroid dehydrogenase/isomerase domain-containing protein n=1 Tax=Pinctada imbricata TaxID=66713 RepID=A0AA88XGK9_PINIB|nr:hypothetical protein FSP39_022470 [Pinctada imbricata]